MLFRAINFGLAASFLFYVGSVLGAERDPLAEAQVREALDALAAQAKQVIADNKVPGLAIAVVHGD